VVQAGAPPGTLNYITTAAPDSAARCAEIIAHPAVRKLTFTGSDRVGRALAVECARHLKPAVLELGGKSAALVLADADVPHAARTIVAGAMANAGQVCMATERVVVERTVAPKLRAAIVKLLEELDEAKTLSPLFAERSAENTVRMLADAKAAGAQFAYGDGTRSGAFVRPHLVTDVPVDSTLWQRESFGPGAPLLSFMRNSTERPPQ
jgi:acyl-CoA reductase-like NAD-dependent aldehyde dehydrogenase